MKEHDFYAAYDSYVAVEFLLQLGKFESAGVSPFRCHIEGRMHSHLSHV